MWNIWEQTTNFVTLNGLIDTTAYVSFNDFANEDGTTQLSASGQLYQKNDNLTVTNGVNTNYSLYLKQLQHHQVKVLT